jgi:hypothetical protein
VAITCACLPMMWTPLSRLFPSLFSTDHGSDNCGGSAVKNSEPNATSRSGINWIQFQTYSDTKINFSIKRTTVSQSRPSEDSTGQILPYGQVGEAQDLNASGIRKVTEYQVSYLNAKLPSS